MISEIDGEELDVEKAVSDRYSRGARAPQAELCCPVSYDPTLLEAIPTEVLDRDYGCGDPTRLVRRGETVLDLGSGAGKACFLASQVVGPEGRVIGVDMNDDMLEVASRNAPEVARRIGFANVAFKKGRIQDLRLDVGRVDALLAERPLRTADELGRFEEELARLRREHPLVASESIDVVVSNCVLNLVKPEAKREVFREIHRVLKRGGRAVLSDIVSDEEVPAELRSDAELWSGCISGALTESAFLRAFADAGFYGITLVARDETPWRTVEGIEFRSVTVSAYKGKEGPCWDRKHAVIYRGPFRSVFDDDGHRLDRGVPTAVCEKTFEIYTREPYNQHFVPVPPRELAPLEEAVPFPCSQEPIVRDPRETKGSSYRGTTEPRPPGCDPSSEPGSTCC